VVAVYNMLEFRGIVKTYPRNPFIQMKPDEKNKFKNKLIEFGILE